LPASLFLSRAALITSDDISALPDLTQFALPPEQKMLRSRNIWCKRLACHVPSSSFYNDARDGANQVRFTFLQEESTLAAAESRLAKLAAGT